MFKVGFNFSSVAALTFGIIFSSYAMNVSTRSDEKFSIEFKENVRIAQEAGQTNLTCPKKMSGKPSYVLERVAYGEKKRPRKLEAEKSSVVPKKVKKETQDELYERLNEKFKSVDGFELTEEYELTLDQKIKADKEKRAVENKRYALESKKYRKECERKQADKNKSLEAKKQKQEIIEIPFSGSVAYSEFDQGNDNCVLADRAAKLSLLTRPSDNTKSKNNFTPNAQNVVIAANDVFGKPTQDRSAVPQRLNYIVANHKPKNREPK